MPVYNAEKYVCRAIDSVLCQDYDNFLFIIVNDCSTDRSEEKILSYSDKRIIYYKNEKNIGVAASLNKALKLSPSKYIARMDADDILINTRFSRQVQFLEKNPEYSVVCANVIFVDEFERELRHWPLDQKTKTWKQIRRQMARANCVAHPTVMFRSEVVLAYGYRSQDYAGEDYGLWLRMCADGCRIGKIPEVLLRYRISSASVTALTGNRRAWLKSAQIKWLFLKERGLKSTFSFAVLFWLVPEAAKEFIYIRLMNSVRKLKHLLFQCGAAIGRRLTVRNHSGWFCFFNYFHTGGAEKVHADILKCFADIRPWVFITLPSRDSAFRAEMEERARLFNLWPLLVPLHPFSTGVMVGLINRHPKPVAFGSNSHFFYKVLPHLGEHVRKVDLLHAFGGGAEDFSLPVAGQLDCRIVINEKTREDLTEQYGRHSLPPGLADRIRLIENRIVLPSMADRRPVEGVLRILYAGRASDEKRVQLIARAARRCRQMRLPVHFSFAGGELAGKLAAFADVCEFLGAVQPDEMWRVYAAADLLVLTSSREGFPLVVMEAMAHGVVPVCTNVGGISRHVRHRENGLLLYSSDETDIVEELVAHIKSFCEDSVSLQELSRSAMQYSQKNFAGDNRFCHDYQQAIFGDGVCAR